LINEVLDISRIEAGELNLSPEAVHVGDLVTEAVELIGPMARERGIQIVIDRSGAVDEYVYADRQRAKQVLINLLSNAVKYNRARGTVSVSCEPIGSSRLRIGVLDTGPGIPKEQLGQLFRPFERLGAEQTAVEGTGIGLALSKRLVEAMGGTLDVESTLGKGSTFFTDLPRAEGPVERFERLHQGGDPQAVPVAVSDHRHVVLYIEDNLANLRLVERIFAARPDVEVIGAMQGRLGLELAREHRPALVLLDLHLPDLNGEQVLHRLREDPLTASVPVVIVSADATPSQVRRLLTAGASQYLTKPIDVAQLLAVLDDAVAAAPV
jgi:CheY-like chemotaxis protein